VAGHGLRERLDWLISLSQHKLRPILLFFEAIPADPRMWFGAPSLVGWCRIVADNPSHSGCINCLGQGQNKYRFGGTVHLTKAMEKLGCPLNGQEPVSLLRLSGSDYRESWGSYISEVVGECRRIRICIRRMKIFHPTIYYDG